MSAQHTPGPWVVSKGFDSPVVGVDPGDCGPLLPIVDTVYGYDKRAAKANARLIAAAPELLEVLESYSLPIDEKNIALSVIEYGTEAVEQELKRRAVIAKATGGAA